MSVAKKSKKNKKPKKTKKRLFGRLRLRHKLALSLSIAALLPVFVASWVAVSVVLRGLDNGLRAETDRQLRVGLSLLLRTVERLGHDAVRLSSSGDLSRAMTDLPKDPNKLEGSMAEMGQSLLRTGVIHAVAGASATDRFLSRESPHLPSALVQITDSEGAIVSERVVGGEARRFAGMGVSPLSPSVRRGLDYESRVTIIRVDQELIVRAVAPIVDPSLSLQGVVVISVPMDGEFADGLKSALRTDVLIVARGSTDAAMTTFLDKLGGRKHKIAIDTRSAERVYQGNNVLTQATISERQYSMGYTPIMDLENRTVGIFAVAVDRAPLTSAKAAATRSLALGAAGAFVFALGLAGLMSRRITRPIQRLHRGAVAISRGDLNYRIKGVPEGDEIGDLARAFSHMTKALKENQARLAARMREIVALHDAGRAISSVIDRTQVLRKIVDSVARVFDVRLCALWLVDSPGDKADEPVLTLGAARAKRADPMMTLRGEDGARLARPLNKIAVEVAVARATLRINNVGDDKQRREAALAAGVTGSLLATPLERKNTVIGIIVVGRPREAKPFSEADSNLLATFADQAATAVENARLYDEVRLFNEELEAKVRLRTTELTAINAELGRTITELRDTQSQLILSERMAGLGQLVAGVAHEINSPSAAIRGSVDALDENVRRLTTMAHKLSSLDLDPADREELLHLVSDVGPMLAKRHMPSPAKVRRLARALREQFTEAGVDQEAAAAAARTLSEMGANDDFIERIRPLLLRVADQAGTEAVTGYLTEYVYLHRSALTIQNAIRKIQRIVGALKSYSHLDQEAIRANADIHEGLEDTLIILDFQLRDITITRDFGELPPVPIYLDELNQVWTNLIHNAVQAMGAKGDITIHTAVAGDNGVVVRIIDNGPGIPEDVRPMIFEPFFTTKGKGEGTGLGLGIVSQIVAKHQGKVTCESEPGRTCFEVWLPLQQNESDEVANNSGSGQSVSSDDGDTAAGSTESAQPKEELSS